MKRNHREWEMALMESARQACHRLERATNEMNHNFDLASQSIPNEYQRNKMIAYLHDLREVDMWQDYLDRCVKAIEHLTGEKYRILTGYNNGTKIRIFNKYDIAGIKDFERDPY